VGVGAKADRDLPSVSADFVSFAKSKGLHEALNLEGAVVSVRDNLNEAYYQKYVAPVDIIARQPVTDPEMALLSESLKCKC
jgi:lipid-binding SYLF domain-containing protein